MEVDLIRITTRDGVQLDGMFQAGGRASQLGIDGLVVVHGTGGNFYSSSLFDFLGEKLLQQGASLLRVNTRGHDGISTAVTARGGLRQGAAYEVVDDCRHDLAGWFDWLVQKVGPRVGFLGHSMGAVKSLYTAAQEMTLSPTLVLAVSPPRLSYSAFCASSRREEFLASFQEAERLVEAGKPNQLLEVTLPLPMAITAAGYLDKYGPEERYNFLNFVRLVRCPTLVLLGSIEVEKNIAFQQVPELLEEIRRPNVSVAVIPGADHFYSGVRPAAWDAMENWLQQGQMR